MIAPAFDGWQFFARRMKDPRIAAYPVIIMTGLGVASEEWARSLGAEGLLRKPIDVVRMLEMIGRRCGLDGSSNRVHQS